jgi:hypothetical protein
VMGGTYGTYDWKKWDRLEDLGIMAEKY